MYTTMTVRKWIDGIFLPLYSILHQSTGWIGENGCPGQDEAVRIHGRTNSESFNNQGTIHTLQIRSPLIPYPVLNLTETLLPPSPASRTLRISADSEHLSRLDYYIVLLQLQFSSQNHRILFIISFNTITSHPQNPPRSRLAASRLIDSYSMFGRSSP